ncbi:MAG: FAD-binding oxidoreductase, partial [Acidimicrobiales bacterium]
LYGACARHGIAVPGGSCPSVGLAGLALGGGLGVVDRKFGLTCDNLEAADVVLASGEVVTCTSSSHSDLFWALRGGGGGNFGVVTEFRFSTHRIGSLALFTLVWAWADAPSVVAAWQDWAPHAPDDLWSNCLLIASQQTPSGSSPVARVTGVYVGSRSALEAELQKLLSAVGRSPFTRFVGTAGYLDAMLIEAGCEGETIPECHLPSQNPAGTLTRAPFAAKSDIVGTPLPSSGINALLRAVETRQTSPDLAGGGIALDASGGAINRVAPTATAYVHRDALFTMQYSANWNNGAPPSVVAANRTWLAQAWGSMRPYVTGGAYQNYIDPALRGWATAYYGENLPRLEQVKATYDPEDVFRFPQSIPLPG